MSDSKRLTLTPAYLRMLADALHTGETISVTLTPSQQSRLQSQVFAQVARPAYVECDGGCGTLVHPDKGYCVECGPR